MGGFLRRLVERILAALRRRGDVVDEGPGGQDPVEQPQEPVEPPEPEQPPEPPVWQIGPLREPEAYPRHFFFWGESRDGRDCGKMLLECGFKAGSRVVVIAKSGRSPVGITARLVWHPVNERGALLSEVLGRIDTAAREGFSVIAVDCELEAANYTAMREIAKRARWHGLRVIQAPKAYLDHLPGSNEEDAAVLNETADVCLGWIYNQHWADGWPAIVRMWHDAGLRIQGVPMCDSGRRANDPGHNSEQDILEVIRGCSVSGLSVGLFNPALPDSREELAEAAKFYGSVP